MEENTSDNIWTLIIRSKNDGLKEHRLVPGQNTIGRRPDNDIVLNDNAASGFHAEFHYDPANDKVIIRDCESTNGTFVNKQQIHEFQVLQNEDQVRLGFCVITVISSESRALHRESAHQTRTLVTSQLISDSIDHYGPLIHEIGRRLVNVSNLDTALTEITAMITRMIGAEVCQIVMADQYDKLNEMGIPTEFAQKTIENKNATILSYPIKKVRDSNKDKIGTKHSKVRMLIVPVLVDEHVVALIFARKPVGSSTNFYESDLQFVLAISNQVAMSIQRNRVESELKHSSYHDSLTDLPNRLYLTERLTLSIARVKQEQGFLFAVFFFNIDNFKDINNSLGHVIGDKLLISIAERLGYHVRNNETVFRNSIIARFGGDEFAILLDDIEDSHSAIAIANRLTEPLSKPYKIEGKVVYISISIGITMGTIEYERPEEILQDADIAMHYAKEMGKSRVEVYDKSMRERVSQRMRLGTAIKQGVLKDEFKIHYQPIVSMQNGSIYGFEALLRWYTPDRGILSPVDFMEAIDTHNLNYSTDIWVLQNACNQAVEWSNKFPNFPELSISVNLSPNNFKNPNLTKHIYQVIQETKINPSRLSLEVTEHVATPDDEEAISVLKKLRSLGIRVSLDDFGTGYSALHYLSLFPIDILKIDRSFVKMIGVNDDSQKVIETIKALASHLGLIVVAEGIEKSEQVPFLRSIKCEYAQGYLFGKPMNSQLVTEFLKQAH